MSYDLDQDQSESFEFRLGGNLYTMKYPTTEEIESLQEMRTEDDQPDAKAQNEFFRALITPVEDKAPSFDEAIKKATIPVMREFNRMIKTEFGLNE